MKTENKKLKKLFDARLSAYEKHTDKIIAEMDGIVAGIKKYIIDEDMFTDTDELEIIATTLSPENGSVFIVAAIKPMCGTIVTLSTGETLEINDEDDRAAAARMLQINVDAQTIDANDEFVTETYIRTVNEASKKAAEAIEKVLLDTSDDGWNCDLSEADKRDEEKLQKMLEGATNPSGMFN